MNGICTFVRMHSLSLSTILLILVLTSDILSAFGELTILTVSKKKKAICVSEDDGGALVWNYNLDLVSENIKKKEFDDPPRSSNHSIDCPFKGPDQCAPSWTFNQTSWQMVDSLNKAMGPVLDKRWEDFDEMRLKEDGAQKYELKKARAVVFSVFGKSDTYLLLCSEKDCNNNYSIIIAGPEKEWSVKMVDVPQATAPPVSMMQWRTFVLQWDDQERNISVFSQTKNIETIKFPNCYLPSHLSAWSPTPSLLRSHFYDYFHTIEKGESLLSPEWNETGKEFCMEMSVGLCSECKLEINVVNEEKKKQYIKTLSGQRSSVGYDLPTWQFVKLKANLTVEFRNRIRLEMITDLQDNCQSPLWAVASVRACPSAGAVRTSEITAIQNMTASGGNIWPNITCQKLSYSGSNVVGISSNAIGDSAKNLSLCPEKKVGPHCAISCDNVVGNDDCKDLSVCRETGCVCSHGYQGSECTDPTSLVKNLRTTRITAFEVTLEWDSPSESNERVTEYIVLWKVVQLIACVAPGMHMPEQEQFSKTVNTTTACLTELHPFARYGVTVIAVTPGRSESSKVFYFDTNSSATIMSVVENLRLDEDTLKWDHTKDCTAITGVITYNLTIDGVSDWVRNVTCRTYSTTATYYELGNLNCINRAATRYKVRVCVAIKEDTDCKGSAYKELNFTTKPRAPPPVEDLEVYEYDSDGKSVSLRWSPPHPPTNGDLESYSVSICDNELESRDYTSVVLVNTTCKLWNNYVCATLNTTDCSNISVWANNKNVSVPGEIRNVSYMMQEKAPEAPTNVTVSALGNGMVNLTWSHPWRTNGKLIEFYINITAVSTDLRGNETSESWNRKFTASIDEYQKEYSKNVNLNPSTVYTFSISGKTRGGTGKNKSIQYSNRAALRFKNEIFKDTLHTNTTIVIDLPSITNDTRDSTMHVIVKGSLYPCVAHSKLSTELIKYANVRDDQAAWRVASFSNGEQEKQSNKQFTIGDNKTRENDWNCPLEVGETYEIVIIVQGGTNETQNQTIAISTPPITLDGWRKSTLTWLIAAGAAAIATTVALLIYIVYRKRTVISKICVSRSCKSKPTTEHQEINEFYGYLE